MSNGPVRADSVQAPAPSGNRAALAAVPEKESRKFVQLVINADGNTCAVASDGTAWWRSTTARCWKEIDPLPNYTEHANDN